MKRFAPTGNCVLVAVAMFLALSAVQTARAAEKASRPNVLMIAVDDLNDWIGCLGGHPQVKTPNIDRLARRGLLFSNAHCQAPICNPSRISLMTGRLPSTTGIYLLAPTQFRRSAALTDCVTMPEYFARHGYSTAGCGKIYHGNSSKETFQSYGPNGSMGPRPKKKLNYPMGHPLWDWGAFPESDDEMPDKKVADWAIGELKKKHSKPFFLAAGFCRPHVPLYAPQKWFDIYPPEDQIELPKVMAGDRDDLPQFGRDLTAGFPAPRHAWFLKNNQWRRAVLSYLACVSFVDHQVGRLLDTLDASPYADNTVIVFWGDHGWALGEKERWAKRALWQRETGVPLIIAAPGKAAGIKTHKAAGLIDLYPTLVELCGLPPNRRVEGHSLAALLADPDKVVPPPTLCTFWVGNHAVITDRWRYIRYSDGSEELYDLRKDPREWHNLAGDAQYAEVISELAKHLPKTNAPPMPESKALGSALEGVPK